jgi:glycosyltransferase involved in cell wall biosynthesis
MSVGTEPEVSIVIPTKDRSTLLRRALSSVEAQDFRDFEIIVVDDGNGEGARAAATFLPGRIQTMMTGGAGQVPARNLGVGAAAGRRIAFLDDDDWWDDPAHLTRMLAASREPCLLYASGRIVAEGQRPDVGASLIFKAYADAASIRRDNQLLVSGVIYHRVLHRQLGRFDEALPYYWDWDWYLRLFDAAVPVIGAESEAVRISAREDSVSAQTNIAARQANLARLAAKHGLGDLKLRNHESIARDGNQPS